MVEISPPGSGDVPMIFYVEGADTPGGRILVRLVRDDGVSLAMGARLSPIQAIAYGNDLVREGLAALDHPDAKREPVTYTTDKPPGDPLPDGPADDTNGPNGPVSPWSPRA